MEKKKVNGKIIYYLGLFATNYESIGKVIDLLKVKTIKDIKAFGYFVPNDYYIYKLGDYGFEKDIYRTFEIEVDYDEYHSGKILIVQDAIGRIYVISDFEVL